MIISILLLKEKLATTEQFILFTMHILCMKQCNMPNISGKILYMSEPFNYKTVFLMQLQSSLSHSQIIHLSRMRFRYKKPGCMRRVKVNINMSYALFQRCSPPAVRINYNWFFTHAYNCTWCQLLSVLETVNLSRNNINNAQCLQGTKNN